MKYFRVETYIFTIGTFSKALLGLETTISNISKILNNIKAKYVTKKQKQKKPSFFLMYQL